MELLICQLSFSFCIYFPFLLGIIFYIIYVKSYGEYDIFKSLSLFCFCITVVLIFLLGIFTHIVDYLYAPFEIQSNICNCCCGK